MRSYANRMRSPAVLQHALLAATTITLMLLGAGNFSPLDAQGLKYGRFRLSPKIDIIEGYSDNVYLEPDNTQDDFYTEISPEIALDFAFAPRNYLTLKYIGNFFLYSEADNFDSEHNFGEASWSLETAKGSRFAVGGNISDNSVQPYSPTERSKDYTLARAFAEMRLELGQVTELGARFGRASRRFDNDIDKEDDYDRDQFDISAVYRRSTVFPLLLQYRYVQQDNSDLLVREDGQIRSINRDYDTQSVFTGASWRPGGKLSGALRVGYTWSNFDNPQIEEFSGFGMDIDVLYSFSEITQLNLVGRRSIEPSTIAERDTGSYYVLTSGGIRLTHHRWEKIITTLRYFYYHRDYKTALAGVQGRVDQEHVAGIDIEYAMRHWFSIILGYQFRKNDSDLDSIDYKENLVQLGVRLSI